MENREVIAYFDAAAAGWDEGLVTDEQKIHAILDIAGVQPGCTVLDVACGTGVLFPYYLERGAAQVIGVDISPEMCRRAAGKRQDARITVICGDAAAVPIQCVCDCCVVYNAFPHFAEPDRLIAHLAQWLRMGGRLTVAHSMGLEALRRHHAGEASRISAEMPQSAELAKLFAPWFRVDTQISDEENYIVSGSRL